VPRGRRSAQRTERRWKTDVGLVGPDDVKALQAKVHDYRNALQASVDAVAAAGNPLPHDQSKFSIQAWADLVGRCVGFEGETTSGYNPFAYLYAGSAYDRGRELIVELDAFRDELANRQAPNVPAPMPVPHSELGIAGGIGFALAALVAILALRELR
jgi:hypothetical protein